jgi:hypothetical protein
MSDAQIGPLDREPVNVRPPFDIRVPASAPPPRRLVEPDAAFENWRKARLADRLAALLEPLEGVELGDYDQRILDWLAGFDVPTVGGVVSLLHRARAARPLVGAS